MIKVGLPKVKKLIYYLSIYSHILLILIYIDNNLDNEYYYQYRIKNIFTLIICVSV